MKAELKNCCKMIFLHPQLLSVLIFIVICGLIFTTLVFSYSSYTETDTTISVTETTESLESTYTFDGLNTRNIQMEVKNILVWSENYKEPFQHLKQDSNKFSDIGCEYTNCFMTNDKKYLSDEKDWSAIMFNANDYINAENPWLYSSPKTRSLNQEYIFVSTDSSLNTPICGSKWDVYFNWTMTYKFDSDIPWTKLAAREIKSGKFIALGENIDWIESMENVSEETKNDLKLKKKFYITDCEVVGRNNSYLEELNLEMNTLGNDVDLVAECGALENSSKILQEEYRFYLAFEDSFDADYLTETFLTAMQNGVVPIVWGGANYTRFAPPNSYIDARKMSPRDLATLIDKLMQESNIDEYAEFFKWKKYYSYHSVYDSYETHPVCRLCKALNDPQMIGTTVKNNIRAWWNGEEGAKRCL